MRSGRGLFREAAPAHLLTEGEESNMILISQETHAATSTTKTQNKNLLSWTKTFVCFFKTRFSEEKVSLWRDDSMFGLICGCILTADPVRGCQMNSQTCGGPCIYCLQFQNTTAFRTSNSIDQDPIN